jgi:hypothetical protein
LSLLGFENEQSNTKPSHYTLPAQLEPSLHGKRKMKAIIILPQFLILYRKYISIYIYIYIQKGSTNVATTITVQL